MRGDRERDRRPPTRRPKGPEVTPRHDYSVAEQCRQMGLRVGDTIIGDDYHTYWNQARLTLLWIGECEAMWSVQRRSTDEPEWTEPREDACWSLSFRDWQRIEK